MHTTPSLEEITRCLLKAFPDARRIILFGSRARDSHDPESDFDLLIVAATALSPTERGTRARMALRGIHAPFDIVVVTPEEFDRLRKWKSTVVAHADRSGKIIHEAA